ncbi:MAG TPA: hemerythrin domain-containing protein [Burkholderiaceae bacterium]|mgnify:CR=1 FL=1|jgi:iron-sulfur cluster repair protein YtfE (RIC family)|nr:hemerythrin domain-containing protein [Burkholderiaceae bacterium]
MNPLIARLSPTATRMIRMDHTHVIEQFHKLQPDTAPAAREAVIRNICTALEIHATLEEEIFYPALREVAPDNPVLADSVPGHDRVRALITTVRGLSCEDPGVDEAMAALMREVMHHMADEETVLLPLAERLLGDRLAELGAQMTERRFALAKPHAGQMAVDLARASPAKATLMVVGTLAAGALMLGSSRRGRRTDL